MSMIVLTPLIPGQLSCPSCFAPSRFFFNVQPKLVFSVFHPGLPPSAFGPYLVSSSPFPPEEEVFSISIERERRAPILWEIDAVEEKMKEDCAAFAFPNSPPPEMVDSAVVKEPATPPPPTVNILF